MEAQIENQPEDLAKFTEQLAMGPVTQLEPTSTIFTGSGDSNAAAIFARELSEGSALAEDPYELSMKSSLTQGKNLVLISVSGRTRANIELARKARGRARKMVAITSNMESSLARICDSSIILRYRKAGTLTSGTVSFTTSLLACAYLVGRLPITPLKLGTSLKGAKRWAMSLRLSSRGQFLFVGSGVDRALAEYGACKIQEVLGARASAQYPEHVGHAQLFSLDASRDNILCIDSSGKGKTTQLAKSMARAGFKVSLISLRGEDVVARSLAASFYLQYLALANAKRRGMTEVAFLQDRKLFRLSNRLIY